MNARAQRIVVAMLTTCIVSGTTSVGLAQNDDDVNQMVIPIAEQAPKRGERIRVETIREGSSSRADKAAAISQLPLRQMTAQNRDIVESVVDNLSLFRRLPTIQLEADPRVYQFFTSHPDVAVSIWRAMGISKVQMWQTGANEYETDTKQGTWGEVNVLLRSPSHYILTCSGEFQSPAARKPIKAFGMMHLQPKYHANGTVTHTVDLFVSFPSQTVETIAKLISPVSNRIADRNFEEISLFVEMMSRAMARQPGWVEQMTFNMDGLLKGRTDDLLKVTAAVYVDAQRKAQGQQGQQASLEYILPPTVSTASMGE